MEAVPRMPMISFELKTSCETPSFGPKLKQYIRDFYNEDGESYNTEIRQLETLRAQAVAAQKTVSCCAVLKRYFCQLHFLQSRFPMGHDAAAYIAFSWGGPHSSSTEGDVRFEMAAVLHNVAALHTQLGADDARANADGMKMCCTHFQCAAWAFQHLREAFPEPAGTDMAANMLDFMERLCLAQAQECILEKSMMDSRKPTIVAKVAVQVVEYYSQALTKLEQTGDGRTTAGVQDIVGAKQYKIWRRYVRFKGCYHDALALLYHGQQAEEQQKNGERVAFYQAAADKLREACKLAKGLDQIETVNEGLALRQDVIEGKLKGARNENEFIYHEEVPERAALTLQKGASLVKGIPFGVNDPEIAGADLFARLVPMAAHQAASLYSEEMAALRRRVGKLVDDKDAELADFVSALRLDQLELHSQSDAVPQELVDRCAALNARPGAAEALTEAVAKLADSCNAVDGMLTLAEQLLQREQEEERRHRELLGPDAARRPPSIAATDLSCEAAKYRAAHVKAAESNATLRKALAAHLPGLQTLSGPLDELHVSIPSMGVLNSSADEASIAEMRRLAAKVAEMTAQRAALCDTLRAATARDDITSALVTRDPNQPIEALFQREMHKHQRVVSTLEQNLAAQANILAALTEANARYAGTRRAAVEIQRSRENVIAGLVAAYDAYQDLLSKSGKGLEFYRKLETNVSKLLQRVKGTCSVQDEERTQLQASLGGKPPVMPAPAPNHPRLKDYLADPGTASPRLKDYLAQPAEGAEGSQRWPSVRPAPVGQEGSEQACPTGQSQATPAPSHQSYAFNANKATPSRQSYAYDATKTTPSHQSYGYDPTGVPQAYDPRTASPAHQSYGYDSSKTTPTHQSLGYDPPPSYASQFGSAPGYQASYASANQGAMSAPVGQSGGLDVSGSLAAMSLTSNPGSTQTSWSQNSAYARAGGYATGLGQPETNPALMGYSTQTGMYQPQTGYSVTGTNQGQAGYSSSAMNQRQAGYSMTGTNQGQVGYSATGTNQGQAGYSATGTNQGQTGYSTQTETNQGQLGYSATGTIQGQTVYSTTGMNQGQTGYSATGTNPGQTGYSATGTNPGQTGYSQQTGTVQGQTGYSTTGMNQGQTGYSATGTNQGQTGYSQQTGTVQGQTGYSTTGMNHGQTGYSTTGTNQGQIGYSTQTAAYPEPAVTPQLGYTEKSGATQGQLGTYQGQGGYSTQSYHGTQSAGYPGPLGYSAASQSQAGTYPDQAGTFQRQAGYSSQTGTNQSIAGYSTQTSTYSGQAATQPTAYSNSAGIYQGQTGYSGTYPVQSGSPAVGYPGQGGTNQGQTGTYSGNSGTYAFQTGTFPQSVTSYSVQNDSYATGQANSYTTGQPGSYSQPGVVSKDSQDQSQYGHYANVAYPNAGTSYPTGTSYANANAAYGNTNNQGGSAYGAQPSSGTYVSAVTSTTAGLSSSSSVDLLAGLDFTAGPLPLTPSNQAMASTQPANQGAATTQPANPVATISQPTNQVTTTNHTANRTVTPVAKGVASPDKKVDTTAESQEPIKKENVDNSKDSKESLAKEGVTKEGVVKEGGARDPYSEPEALRQLAAEVDKLDKFVEGLTAKTLNGPTPLDLKWKELQDLQEREGARRSISVARCYPTKNRCADVLPYDDSRVELPGTKDDYINASHIAGLSNETPALIATQYPLQSTMTDFWTMVWQQQTELVVCLLGDSELPEAPYWPEERGSPREAGEFRVALQSKDVSTHVTRRIVTLSCPRGSRNLVMLQLTSWPGSSFPASPVGLLTAVRDALWLYGQQRGAAHPIVVHCNAGVGRTGLFCLLLSALASLNQGKGVCCPFTLAGRLSTARRQALRDREHLRFAYQALLYQAQDVLLKRGVLGSRPGSFDGKRPRHARHPSDDFVLASSDTLPAQGSAASAADSAEEAARSSNDVPLPPTTAAAASDDPLGSLDPYWRLKRTA